MPSDFYEVLGVPRSASAKEIQSAYRRLARRYHPDVTGGDAEAEDRFKEINAAHGVLGDDKKRAAYDKWGERWEHAEQLEQMERNGAFGFQQPGGQPGWQPGGGFGPFGHHGGTRFRVEQADLGGLGGLFEGVFGGFGGGAPAAQGRDIEHPVTVSLREAFQGSSRTIQAPRSGGGSGAGADAPRFSRIEVKIPPGVATGSRVKVSGKGAAGPGGAVGDLYLVITVEDDPRFERKGDDLYTDAEVPIATAALGGEVAVPTLTGRVALRIPQGTQNGRVFRLAGQGMPRLRGGARDKRGGRDKRGERGDLLARAQLQLPDPLQAEHLELFRRLRALEQPDEATEGSED